ncbi:hypothetical protein KEJ15_06795 [Candidatus Bathyarchaeota archaeon]|nr:hypothetical protein [Candidatus Bathyarchaeota archaeon]
MKVPKIMAIIGIVVIVLGLVIAIVSTTTEVWNPKSDTLAREVATVYSQSHYWPLLRPQYIPEESRNLMINGYVEGLKGRTFDLYVFNKVNYELWKAGAAYKAYLEAINVTSHSFSMPVRREDVGEGLRLVVSNIYAKELATKSLVDEVVTVYQWMNYTWPLIFPPFIPEEPTEVKVSGTAKETRNQRFNLIILDHKNYDLWKAGQPYNAFYEMRNGSTCSFTYPLTSEQAKKSPYFIVQRTEPDTELKVQISANISYMKPVDISVRYDVDISWEEKSYAQVLGGLILGGGLIVLGAILMIVAAVVKYVFKK